MLSIRSFARVALQQSASAGSRNVTLLEKRSHPLIYFIFSVIIILIDRGIKLWIIRSLEVGQAMEFIPGILRIIHVENTGAAFSIFNNMRWPLVVVSSVAVIVLAFVILLYRDGEIGRLAASFMLGGAVGNLVDRIVTGAVTDMFEPEFMNFAVFNVADIFVVVGCIIFVIHLIHLMIKQRGQKEAVVEPGKAAKVRAISEPVAAERAETVEAPMPMPEPMPELTEQQILMEYYMELDVEDSDI